MGWVGIAMAAVGTLMSMKAAQSAAEAAQSQAGYESAMSRNNAQISENNKQAALSNQRRASAGAKDTIQRGRAEAVDYGTQVAQLKGRQRAVMAANGVLLDEGTPLDITSDTAAIGKLDQLRIMSNAEREAEQEKQQAQNFGTQAGNFEIEKQNYGNEAVLQTRAGYNKAEAQRYEAIGSLVSGGGSVADKWYNRYGGGKSTVTERRNRSLITTGRI